VTLRRLFKPMVNNTFVYLSRESNNHSSATAQPAILNTSRGPGIV